MALDRQSAQNRENLYIAFIFRHNYVRIVKFKKENVQTHSQRRYVFCSILAFLIKFLFAKVTKFARFCKQKPWQEKSVMLWVITREILIQYYKKYIPTPSDQEEGKCNDIK